MDENIKVLGDLKLSGTDNGKIEVAILNNPYGNNSKPVVSIGVFLKSSSEEPNWKVHIPKDNISDIIKILEKAKSELN